MLRGGDVKEIQELRRQGLSVSQIGRITGYCRDTIRRYVKEGGTPRYGPRPRRATKLAPHLPFVEERLKAGVWNAAVLLRELKERGYSGGYTQLKDYLQPKREAAFAVATRRFETPPGQQAQVDWGEIGFLENGPERKKLSCFVLTLSHSRALFTDLATDQRLGTLLRMHEAAFESLGGVPEEILYDWMKTVATGTDDRGEVVWNRTFADFARYWGFAPRLCRPYRPQTKGKTERGVGYVKGNFLPGREASGFEDLRDQLRGWVREVALRRIHGTTHRIVSEAWEDEKPFLRRTAGQPPYPYEPIWERKVARDAYVSYRTNRYPVPWRLAGTRVSVVERGGEVVVLHEGQPVARHERRPGRHETLEGGAYHDGMPTSDATRRKASIVVEETIPLVEVRDLSVYEAIAREAAR